MTFSALSIVVGTPCKAGLGALEPNDDVVDDSRAPGRESVTIAEMDSGHRTGGYDIYSAAQAELCTLHTQLSRQ